MYCTTVLPQHIISTLGKDKWLGHWQCISSMHNWWSYVQNLKLSQWREEKNPYFQNGGWLNKEIVTIGLLRHCNVNTRRSVLYDANKAWLMKVSWASSYFSLSLYPFSSHRYWCVYKVFQLILIQTTGDNNNMLHTTEFCFVNLYIYTQVISYLKYIT